jgi:hypothetical protein
VLWVELGWQVAVEQLLGAVDSGISSSGSCIVAVETVTYCPAIYHIKMIKKTPVILSLKHCIMYEISETL